jgi:hypothetical protein
VSNVADEYAALPDGEMVYTELLNVANRLTCDMYLREVDKRPPSTDLAGKVAEQLADHDVEYEDWYSQHHTAKSADWVGS